MPELTMGAHIGPYELEAEIGRGGMARVFRARQPSLDRTVALKILAPDLARDAVFVARFRQEALIAAALEHPNIAPIYDVGETNGQPYLAMRYVPGRSLADALRQDGPFSVGRAGRIVEQIARALDYAHSRGVVHRDLKPANILLQTDDFACLVDFGIARAGDGTRLTRIGQIAGTPAYMSPEQIQGLPGDYLSDLYALGILAFELLSGRVPYNADSDVATLHQHVYEAPPSIRALRPDLPRFVEQAIERMIAKRPDDRFHSGAAFAAALTNPLATEPARRGGRRNAWIPAAAAAAAVAVSALALVVFRSPGEVSVSGVSVTPAVAVAQGPVVSTPTIARTAPPATATVSAPPAATPAPVLDAKAACAQRMAGVDAVWETDLTAAVARLEDVVNWDATCGDAKNKLYAARVNRARELLHADRSSDALALLRQAIQDNPGGGEAVVLERLTGEFATGQQAASSADWPKAIEALSQVQAEDPGFADGKAADLLFRAYVNYGNSFSAAQQWPQAREQYAAAAALRADDGPTQDLLAAADQHLRSSGPLVPPVAALDAQTRQDVLAAIQRSNSAWSNARASLNTADLASGMAGQELQDDIQVVNALRQQDHYVMSSELSFAATRFTPSGPNRVYVETQESWQDDVYDVASRQRVKHDPPTSYSETYTVDRINGRWIVTLNQVH